MLYNCLDNTPANPRGIYMRAAEQPWGPWSAPQTLFNPERDGGYYGPYFLSRYTTGDAAKGTSTFYYTLSTWIPYTEVIIQSSIQRTP